jgi:hypothetical protein
LLKPTPPQILANTHMQQLVSLMTTTRHSIGVQAAKERIMRDNKNAKLAATPALSKD